MLTSSVRHIMRAQFSGAALAVVALLCGCTSVAWPLMGARPNPAHDISASDQVFLAAADTWDRNHDSQVTCKEWHAYITEVVTRADKSKDGAVDKDEFVTLIQIDRLFLTAGLVYWDTNKDGKITEAEMIAHANPAFTLLDRNKDCVLSSTELLAVRKLQSSPGPGGGPPAGGPGGGPPGGGDGPPGGGGGL